MHLLVPDVGRRLQQRAPGGGADNRDHAIEAAKLLLGFGDDAGDLRVVEHVADDGDGLGAERGDLGGDLFCSFRNQIDERDIAAGAGQEAGGGFAHALAATDDHGLLAGEAK